jgi:predicted transcriptional regulator
MKAIIELGKKGSVFNVARKQIAAGEEPDFHLSFESARTLFSLLTPARIDLLETLRRVGPCNVNALAKAAGRNYSNVHTDVVKLEELGLVERADDESVFVPYEGIDIRLALPLAA